MVLYNVMGANINFAYDDDDDDDMIRHLRNFERGKIAVSPGLRYAADISRC